MSKRTTPGLRRLRASPKAESIRTAVLDDQQAGRAEALARIEAEAAAQTPADAPAPADGPSAPANAAKPATARPKRARAAIEPTPVPMPAESMPGMSKAHAALYMAAGRGEMPTPPDFSKPSYAPDRKRLQALSDLAEAGDAAALRAYAIRVFYTGAQALDRYRHRAIIAIEAQRQERAA